MITRRHAIRMCMVLAMNEIKCSGGRWCMVVIRGILVLDKVEEHFVEVASAHGAGGGD